MFYATFIQDEWIYFFWYVAGQARGVGAHPQSTPRVQKPLIDPEITVKSPFKAAIYR